ncbi:MAG: hypothetical protein AB1568_03455 [Thermodesulfobacteriota bacterium]
MQPDDSPRMVIRDIPLFEWGFGVLFAGAGTVIVVQGGLPVFGGVFAAVGAGFLLFSSVLTITADRTTRTLSLDYRSALRHTSKQLPFEEIAGINVERRSNGGRRGITYRLTLLRQDGEVIPCRSSSSSGWKGKERRAVRLREFLGIQDSNRIPSGILPAELARAGESRETNGVGWHSQPMFTAHSATPTGVRWHSPDFRTPGLFLLVAQKAEGQPSGGLLASLGSMFLRQALALHGFSAEDTPDLERVVILPLEPALDRHFMAYTNAPATAPRLLHSRVGGRLADWAARYPLRQKREGSRYGQLMTLFGPNGVSLATLNLAHADQAHELVALGVDLVKELNTPSERFPDTHE